MKIGVLLCAYGNSEYVYDCLDPWIKAKKSHDILIAAVHGQFKEYHDLGIEDNDITTAINLIHLEKEKKIDNLYIQNKYWEMGPIDESHYIYQTEAEIRDKGLQWLLKQNCDIIWLLDLDEFYTRKQIEDIIRYINLPENGLECWFSINFKNYIFDGKQWIDGFCPPRIFRVSVGDMINLRISCIYYDNDVLYECTNDFPGVTDYKKLRNKKIPKDIAQIKHLTWLNSNGKDKVSYQLKHFGSCSYLWNETAEQLEFNLDFYKRNNLELPTVYQDD